MKKYIKPIPIFLIVSAVAALYVSLRYDTPRSSTMTGAADSTIAAVSAGELDRPPGEIPLPDQDGIRELFYNPAKNAICLIRQSGKRLQLSVLGVDDAWVSSTEWTVPANAGLSHFVYGTDGKLYACLTDAGKKKTGQKLVRLRKNGTISEVPLTDLEKAPETTRDAAIKKKGTSTPQTITDIKFSGTALAITYQNNAVKFYNVEEGQALGASTLRGEPHQSIFYKYHYLTSYAKKSTALRLRDYDIRTGILEHTMIPAAPDCTDRDFYLSSYKENIWLLSADGLYTGSFADPCFRRILSLEETGLPKIKSLQLFQAARDHVIYISYAGDDGALHLIRTDTSGDVPSSHAGNQTAIKNELDFSPSV